MLPPFGLETRKKLKDILDVTTNVVVVLFAVVAIGMLDVVIGGKGCTGCFIPNGSSGCGSCSGGPSELD